MGKIKRGDIILSRIERWGGNRYLVIILDVMAQGNSGSQSEDVGFSTGGLIGGFLPRDRMCRL